MVEVAIGGYAVCFAVACDTHCDVLMCRLSDGCPCHRLVIYHTKLPACKVGIVELPEHFARLWVVGSLGCHNTVVPYHFRFAYHLPRPGVPRKVNHQNDAPAGVGCVEVDAVQLLCIFGKSAACIEVSLLVSSQRSERNVLCGIEPTDAHEVV